jgi:hypothetical protein
MAGDLFALLASKVSERGRDVVQHVQTSWHSQLLAAACICSPSQRLLEATAVRHLFHSQHCTCMLYTLCLRYDNRTHAAGVCADG